jgi:hypothetical protein
MTVLKVSSSGGKTSFFVETFEICTLFCKMLLIDFCVVFCGDKKCVGVLEKEVYGV